MSSNPVVVSELAADLTASIVTLPLETLRFQPDNQGSEAQ